MAPGSVIIRATLGLVRGRRSHVWLGEVHDETQRLVASGRVRLLVLEPGAEAAGATIEHEPSGP